MKDLIVNDEYIQAFLKESLAIEGITRNPTEEEIAVTKTFVFIERPTLEDVLRLVKVYNPKARLRNESGLNLTRVGNYYPPEGGERIHDDLSHMITDMLRRYMPQEFHFHYESLHPFTDANGTSGRTLWLWGMIHHQCKPKLSFLHHFYYQSLDELRQKEFEYEHAPRSSRRRNSSTGEGNISRYSRAPGIRAGQQINATEVDEAMVAPTLVLPDIRQFNPVSTTGTWSGSMTGTMPQDVSEEQEEEPRTLDNNF